MARYECSNCGIITYKQTTSSKTPPGRNCEECGDPVAPVIV